MSAVIRRVALIDLVYISVWYLQHGWKVLTFGVSFSVLRIGATSVLKLGGRQSSLLFLIQDISYFYAQFELSFLHPVSFFSQSQSSPFDNMCVLFMLIRTIDMVCGG